MSEEVGFPFSEVLPPAFGGERVDRVVAMLTGCSRAEAAAVLSAGAVRLDAEVVVKPSVRVSAGQSVTIDRDPAVVAAPPGPDPAVDVRAIYVDDDLIVVDKPPGLVVHPAPGHRGGTLVNGLLARYPELAEVGEPHRPGLVHRLDKGTSGLLVVARTPAAHERLVELLATHQVDREYRALVWGALEVGHGTIDAPVGRSRRDPLKMTVAVDGRFARTHYEVLSTWHDPVVTLLACRLETGRTHQIRVHLRSIGRTVVDDDLYGGVRPGLRVGRPFLHATRLSFDHPTGGQRLVFDSPLPDDLAAVLERLGPPTAGGPGKSTTTRR